MTGEPDVIVTEPKRNPITIEDKVDGERSPNLSGEKQLKDFYLGKTLKTIGRTIHTGIAVRFPHRFREIEQAELDEKDGESRRHRLLPSEYRGASPFSERRSG